MAACRTGVFVLGVLAFSPLAHAQPDADQLKALSLEELLNVEVVSVSRRGEKLSQTASALQIITNDDIRRSGATRLPELLRLAANLQVAQINSSGWAVSARGFNNAIANKMLVLLDGRTLYTPLFAGTFWETQGAMLYDIDRIEIVSGPGATQWGANAVNGVINIISKRAAETQGLLLRAAAGTELDASTALRYGGKIGDSAHFRVYGTYLGVEETAVLPPAPAADDDWRIGQAGFRFDWRRGPDETLAVHGDAYDGRIDQGAVEPEMRGHNLVARWARRVSASSEVQLQTYYDRASRLTPGQFEDDLDTFDLDFQHRYVPNAKHDLVWGLAYRLVEDDFRGGLFQMDPARASLHRLSGFVQDEIMLVPDRLFVTLGTKLEDNEYTGFEWQPAVRIAWRPRPTRTLWAAVSRAVRTPSRLDRDLFVPGPPFFTVSNDEYQSENVIAYEIGARLQPLPHLSVTTSAYFNDYDDIRSVEPLAPPAPVPITLRNGLRAQTYGLELTVDYRASEQWRLWGGYAWLDLDFAAKPGSLDTSGGQVESRDWDQQLFVRSSFDLTPTVELDAAVRFIDEIANQGVPSYSELDLRLAWQATPRLELSVAGRNLLDEQHAEFGPESGRRQIERSVHGQLVWRH